MTANNNENVLALKRKALEAKKAGDIESAKNFLRQAKQLELQIQQQQQQAEEELENETIQEDAAAATPQKPEDPVNKAMDEANLDELTQPKVVKFSDEELMDVATLQDFQACGIDIPSLSVYRERILANKKAALQHKNTKNIPAAKQSLSQAKQLEKAMTTLYPATTTATTPTKPNDDNDDEADMTPEDLQLLQELKQMSTATNSSSSGNAGATEDDGFLDQLFGSTVSTALDLNDLDDMDAALLQDMMEAGMEIPSVQEIRANGQQKKATAIEFKKKGDLVSAKAALQESKRLEAKAMQLESMLKTIERQQGNGGVAEDDDDDENEDPDAALERMMKQQQETGAHKKAPPKKEPLKSSAEYKIQAVQFKQQGNKEQALASLRLYKQALAAEQQAKSIQQCKDNIAVLQKEAQFASEQVRLYSYYKAYCPADNAKKGQALWKGWNKYGRDCTAQAMTLEMQLMEDESNNGKKKKSPKKEGQEQETTTTTSTAAAVASSAPLQRCTPEATVLRAIKDNDLTFVGSTCDSAEEGIEISVLELQNLHTNKHLRKTLLPPPSKESSSPSKNDATSATLQLPKPDTIQIQMTIHLPPSAETPDADTNMKFQPTSILQQDSEQTYVFEHDDGKIASQYVHAERGTSRFAKLLARRIATRKRCMTIQVYYQHKISKGLFSKTQVESILLGSAGCELKELVDTKNYLALDLPLVESRRETGGVLRLAIRTGTPFGSGVDPATTNEADNGNPVLLEPYPHLLLSTNTAE